MKITKKIRIELKSDLCIASGYSYAGLIDSDICYDKWGIPYIPGRRLKGCLRETAEKELYVLTKKHREGIFGKSHDNGTKGIIIENAHPEHYLELVSAIREIEKSSELKECLTPERILGEYTTIKAQTRLDSESVADDQTLRYSRTVNQYAFDKKAMVFETTVTYESDIVDDEILSLIISATKHIGLNRNRGLGNVRCSLGEIVDTSACVTVNDDRKLLSDDFIIDENDKWVLKYCIRNVEPLMLSNMSDSTSETFIRGQSVLGLLAAQYLQDDSNAADSEEFRDLFLNGQTCFSDLVISKDGKSYSPAPLFVRKLKKSGKYVNIEFSYDENDYNDDEIEQYNPQNGNRPKKLSDKYIHFGEDNCVDIVEVEKHLMFHHSHKGTNRYGNKAILYANEAIAEDQDFSGTIILPYKYVDKMLEILLNADFRFGKSKTAQYGKCILKSVKVKKHNNYVTTGLNAGDKIAVVFLSDTLVLHKKDNAVHYTVFRDEVMKQVAAELEKMGVKCQEIAAQTTESAVLNVQGGSQSKYISYLESVDVAGYNAKLNLRKASLPAIKAGSAICYQLNAATTCSEGYIGEKNHEGYGHFAIIPFEKMQYRVNVVSDSNEQKTLSTDKIAPARAMFKNILLDLLKEEIKLKAITDVDSNRSELKRLTSSTVGRVTMMLQESMEEYSGEEAFEDFYKRIESIKRKNELLAVRESLLSKVSKLYIKKEKDDAGREKQKTEWELSAESIQKLFANASYLKEFLEKIGVTAEEIDECTKSLWSEYIMTALVFRKYQLAER